MYSGFVDCVDGFSAIFRTDGQTYALNGTARSRGYAEIDPIWRDNSAIPGAKINIGPLIDLANQQCER